MRRPVIKWLTSVGEVRYNVSGYAQKLCSRLDLLFSSALATVHEWIFGTPRQFFVNNFQYQMYVVGRHGKGWNTHRKRFVVI